jgi:hypothetical protein
MFLSGTRLEIRTNGAIIAWPLLRPWLLDLLMKIMSKCQLADAEVHDMYSHVCHALGSASSAGLFSHTLEEGQKTLPVWKKHSYYRLLQVMGIMSHATCRPAMLADMQGKPWGDPGMCPSDPAGASVAQDGPALAFNPSLPDGVFKVFLPTSSTSLQVSRLGMTHWAAIDWGLAVRSVGRPDLLDLVVNVARLTKWRRCPGGRGASKRQHPNFTASKLEGQGMVGALGDHLALAALNLVAIGLHTAVKCWPH